LKLKATSGHILTFLGKTSSALAVAKSFFYETTIDMQATKPKPREAANNVLISVKIKRLSNLCRLQDWHRHHGSYKIYAASSAPTSTPLALIFALSSAGGSIFKAFA
jgi:hypothetical protein